MQRDLLASDLDFKYQNLLREALLGYRSETRMGTSCHSVFAPNPIKTNNLPLLNVRKQFWKSIVIELIWLLRGNSDLDILQKHGVRFWNPWALEDNSLGKAYPYQFRQFSNEKSFVDQLSLILKEIKNEPHSRRIMMNIWNSADLDEMAIPPCCFAHQVRIVEDKLHMFVFQRSCDILVGLPQNMATYGLLQRIYAQVFGIQPGTYHHLISDAHVYSNQIKSARKILDMDLDQFDSIPYVTIDDRINSPESLLEFLGESGKMSTEEIMNLFGLHNYRPSEYFKIPVSV